MALPKQGFDILFGQGLDLKTDPNQVQAGKFLALENTVFEKNNLKKRNGFPLLATLPDTDQTTLTTLNDNLIATGTKLLAFSEDTSQWLDQGIVQPVNLETQTLVRSNTSQTVVDSAVSESGLACTAYIDGTEAFYKVNDVVTGQTIVQATALPATSVNARVFVLGVYFIITFGVTVAGNPHLQYIVLPITHPNDANAPADLATNISSINGAYDGKVSNNNLYVFWNAGDIGGAIRGRYLTNTLALSAQRIEATYSADLISVTTDDSGNLPEVWVTFWLDGISNNGWSMLFNNTLIQTLPPTQIIVNSDIAPKILISITSIATDGTLTVFYELDTEYTYMAVDSHDTYKVSITSAGDVGDTEIFLRGVGLGSKAFFDAETGYVLVSYGQTFQPTYFLADWNANIIAKVAYSNGAGYVTTQILPSATVIDDVIYIAYLIKDLLIPVNKSQGVVTVNGVYTQTGINMLIMDINTDSQQSSEIADCLHLTGGMLWQYDTVKPVEHGFHVWPEDILATASDDGGDLTEQQYFHVVTYEWTDAQGNLHRSAPSVPVGTLLTSGEDTITLNIPMLRLTYKTDPNPVRIVVYRWSTAQQTYYQITSISDPLVNVPEEQSIEYVDDVSDADILGNNILYTTGGVVENIAAPACSDSTLYKSRVVLIDAENPNVLWYSKQVGQGTPVEFSDQFTIYVAPTIGSQGSTGPNRCVSAMDDKLIMFKDNAVYYLTGDGPDATGANNNFSEPVYITSTVGCNNPRSIVLTPVGIMFQSNKGIWLLGRDLSTKYIGADVENYNGVEVNSAVQVPGTNQIRFTLSSGVVLVYDYYFNQWGTFNGIPSISSVIHKGTHAVLNIYGQVRQQSADSYLDGSSPVLLKFTSAWIKLNNVQNFQRAYYFFLLGNYLTPHKLQIQIAYDYNPAIVQQEIIEPTNFNPNYGDLPLYGSNGYGGESRVEQWRVFLNKQKCQSVQITVAEIYDPSKDVPAGAGLTLTGLNFVIGQKATYPKLTAKQST